MTAPTSGSSPVARALGPDDAADSARLGAEAFGSVRFPVVAPAPGTWPPPGLHAYGVHGRTGGTGGTGATDLVAKLAVRDDESWWGGARLATAGIAGVAVRPEQRGQGLLTPLFDVALREARERGAVVSTLFATAPGIYRRFGYELVTELLGVEVPTAPLGRVRVPAGVELVRAEATDTSATAPLHEVWASAQNGPLTRRGPVWEDVDVFEGATATTLAVEDGAPTGYATWRRPQGYGDAGELEVLDLVATTPGAGQALWSALGSFASVAPTLRLRTSGADALRLAVPAAGWRPVEQHPYSLRLLDLPRAVAGRGVGPLDVRVPLRVVDDAYVGGAWVLAAEGGRATCVPGDAGDGPTLTGAGLALLWSGARSCADLRFTGHLGGPRTHDAALDALFGGRAVHVRDYF